MYHKGDIVMANKDFKKIYSEIKVTYADDKGDTWIIINLNLIKESVSSIIKQVFTIHIKEKQLYNDLSKLFIDLKISQDPTEKLPEFV